MRICYIDEAGCPGALPSSSSNMQPVLVIAGVIVPARELTCLTREFLALKKTFNPGLLPPGSQPFDIARLEIKGADLRRDMRQGNRNRRRTAYRFLDQTLALLKQHDAQLMARIYVKAPAGSFDGMAVYTSAIQAICSGFQHMLQAGQDQGMVIADSRTPSLNSRVSHSIFTQKFRAVGDPLSRVLEMPTFGHSENHAVLQITDLLCSAILVPMSTSTYCTGHVNSVHISA